MSTVKASANSTALYILNNVTQFYSQKLYVLCGSYKGK